MIIKYFRNKNLVFGCMLLLVFLFGVQANSFAQKWVGTWSCAPYAAANNTPPAPYLENNTFRQIVRTSIGGDTLRVKFSNITSSTPVTINSVNIAVSTEVGGSAIDISTLKQLTFSGNESVTMEAYTDIASDPFAFPLTPGMHLAITIYYGQCKTAADMTHHYGSRTDSYILEGDQTQNADFSGATRIERWYTINTIDVLTSENCAAVVALGNSITDGYGLHGGLKNKWTDKFSEKLLADSSTSHVSVLNMGIGATWLTTSGVNRYQQDVLDQNGLRWIIIFYGVNDIGGNASASAIINAYKKMIAQAHAQNVRVYGATITPFKGSGYYSAAHEAVRVEVNEWIRTSGSFDAYIDFDQVIRDPEDPEKMLEVYSNDWLHPNADGYRVLGESIDLDLFLGGDTIFEQPTYETHYFEAECGAVGSNWKIVENGQASNNNYVTVKAGVESKDGAAVGDENLIHIPFTITEQDNYSIYARVNCPSPDDDSFWVIVDGNEALMVNGINSAGWDWKSFGDYSLTPGNHTLTISYREDGALLDKICILNSPFLPAGMGDDAENKCEVETEGNGISQPEKLKGIQNFPNPFGDSTTIKFSINENTKVSVNIFDINGRKVTELLNKTLKAGIHSVVWNGTNDAGSKQEAGKYICSIWVGDKQVTQDMLLIR